MSPDLYDVESKGQADRWMILPTPPKIDYFICLQQDEAELAVYLRPLDFEGRFLKVSFDNAISFRNSQESLWFNSVDAMDKELWGATFYKIANSAFVRQFHEYSSNAFDDWNVTHYAILTSNFCVDILSTEEPTVEWVDKLPMSE